MTNISRRMLIGAGGAFATAHATPTRAQSGWRPSEMVGSVKFRAKWSQISNSVLAELA